MQRTGSGQKIVVRAFSANTRFNRVAVDTQLVLCQRQLLPAGHQQLPFHQVKPGNRFGHWMLYLQARVHLHEVKLHAAVWKLFHNEFNRPSPDVINSPRSSNRCLAHLLAHGVAQAGCRRFFQHLLVAALHRAITLKQVHIVAMHVAKHLNFNMPWALRVFFNQHVVIAKAARGFAFAGRERGVKIFRLVNRAHAFAAAAGTGLDQHRVADAICFML